MNFVVNKSKTTRTVIPQAILTASGLGGEADLEFHGKDNIVLMTPAVMTAIER